MHAFRETDPLPEHQRQQESRTLCYNFVAFVSDAKQAKRYLVSGRVQGVGFRYFTQAAAEKLRIGGFVRNLRDGRVEVFAVGTPQQHRELRAMLERGPHFSSVSEVLEEPATPDRQYDGDFFINSND
jgi:acylphosphatase